VTGIDYFAWVVFVVIIASLLVGLIVLGQLPGKIAAKNNHPQVKAITVASWLGLLMTFGIVWVLAMVWASMVPQHELSDATQQRLDALEAKVRRLEHEGEQGEKQGGGAA